MDHLEHCRRELDRFETLLDGDLRAPVVHCGSWDLYRLADHLGRQNLWSAAGITLGHGDYTSPRAPETTRELKAWFRGTSDTLLTALARDPDAPAWTIYPPATVGFWRRRRAHETLIHRWDAENALGIPSVIDDELAVDGIAEVFDTMLPRQLELGRAVLPEGVVTLEAPGFTATWGAGEPAVTVKGTRQQLLLLLWKRVPPADLRLIGDRAVAEAFFATALVP